MMSDPGQIAFGLAMPPAIGYGWCRVFKAHGLAYFYWGWLTSAGGGIIGASLPPAAWDGAWASAVSFIIAAVLLWLSRRRRKRAPKLIGDKARLIIAAMVARLRETAKPRPVLRPVPGGAR